ncbi:hypothetical protein [Rheinheimera sp.]|uniref:hypothetical protein n=1 Tax=Rheinheimera sp. TaxID=1869214 RepID=UPI002734730F|nr:hypothetical protein [Rheinheimera sp.]MDP2715106.1 hypothetical protein [Rheinheimera sp.]
MVQRLICPLLYLLALHATPAFAQAAINDKQQLLTEKHYRQAAWAFYQQQPAQALEALQLAPQQDQRTQLLEAGLYLQLQMPQHAAEVLARLLAADSEGDNALPAALRNIALLQFARYQLESGDKAAARQYLAQVKITADGAWLGQQQLLSQLISWPDIEIPAQPDFVSLAQQPEMPYIISNQALVLAKQQPEIALQWLSRLQQQLAVDAPQGFWQLLFSGQWPLQSQPQGFVYPQEEQQALDDYVQLTQAQLLIEQQDLAGADRILANFGADSVLSSSALQLYSHILTEQRHIPALLAVLQQQIKQQPFSLTAWQAATRIGEQLERSLQPRDALAAYHWAQQYYQQQTQLINQQATPLQVNQLQQGLSQWQTLQLSNDNNLHRLQQDALALQQQLNAAPQRQQRLLQLQEITAYKLTQQQQLLTGQLPLLVARKQQLSQRYTQLQQQINEAATAPMALALWQGEPYQQLSRLERSEQRLQQLEQSGQPTAAYRQRLQRLRGLLQWQYSDSTAQRRWQFQRAQQQLATQLSALEQQLAALQQRGGKAARLQQLQQRLAQLTQQQQQLNLALLSQQQQLLAQLNQQLQQIRRQQLAQLTQLQRHNKESMARVMERVLLMADANADGGQP